MRRQGWVAGQELRQCVYYTTRVKSVNLLSRKRDSLSLTTERVGRGNDRLVAQPTGRGHAPTGTVLGRNVARRIQVGIEMKSTLPTLEYTSRTAVVAGGMPTPAARLGGVG